MFENSFNQNLRTLIQIRLLFKNIPEIDGKGLPQEEATMSSGMAQGLQKVSKVPRSWKKPDPPPRNLQNTKDPLPMYCIGHPDSSAGRLYEFESTLVYLLHFIPSLSMQLSPSTYNVHNTKGHAHTRPDGSVLKL